MDLPSGLDADTGAVPGVVLPADRTVTFGCAKPGLLLSPGCTVTGQLSAGKCPAPAGSLAAASAAARRSSLMIRPISARSLSRPVASSSAKRATRPSGAKKLRPCSVALTGAKKPVTSGPSASFSSAVNARCAPA
ncbi:MAG: NAD(P)H-hydrate epimerase [Alphaproteobacteria bacterium]